MSEDLLDTFIMHETPAQRAVNYTGFGLKLAECLDLSRKLRDEPYAYDKDGKPEFELDLNELTKKLTLLYDEFISNREAWSE